MTFYIEHLINLNESSGISRNDEYDYYSISTKYNNINDSKFMSSNYVINNKLYNSPNKVNININDIIIIKYAYKIRFADVMNRTPEQFIKNFISTISAIKYTEIDDLSKYSEKVPDLSSILSKSVVPEDVNVETIDENEKVEEKVEKPKDTEKVKNQHFQCYIIKSKIVDMNLLYTLLYPYVNDALIYLPNYKYYLKNVNINFKSNSKYKLDDNIIRKTITASNINEFITYQLPRKTQVEICIPEEDIMKFEPNVNQIINKLISNDKKIIVTKDMTTCSVVFMIILLSLLIINMSVSMIAIICSISAIEMGTK